MSNNGFKWMFSILFLAGMCFGLAACSSDDSYSHDTNGYDLTEEDLQLNEKEDAVARFPFTYNGITPEVKLQLTSKADIPGWLVSKINIWEKDDPMRSTAVYSGEWEGTEFFYVFCGLQQTMLGELYKKDESSLGGCFSYEIEGSLESFLQTSSNWKLIYCTDISKFVEIYS